MKRQNVVLDDTFTKSDRENAEKKNGNFLKKLNHQRICLFLLI